MKRFLCFLLACSLTLGPTLTVAQEFRSYYVTDVIGSPVVSTDPYANATWSEDYRPYGDRIVLASSTSKDGDNERWFSGAPQSDISGLVSLGGRYYDPVVGRFVSMDLVGVSDVDGANFNRYWYANNNPYKFVDPDGELPVFLIPALIFGFSALLHSEPANAPVPGEVPQRPNGAAPLSNLVAPGSSTVTRQMVARESVEAAAGQAAERGLWRITKEGTAATMRHGRFGSFHKSKSDGLWWSKDHAGHGGSAWKVFEETAGGLKWKADADKYGDFITGKHKSDIGALIPWGELAGVR